MRAGFAFLLLLALLAACAENKAARPTAGVTSTPPPEPSETPAPSHDAPAPASTNAGWSPTVQGLRGRLVLTKAGNAAKPQVRIDLEIENVSDSATPIELWWADPSTIIDLSLVDARGTVLPKLALPGSYATPPPAWLSVPVNSATRFTLSKGAYEYVPGGRVMLRPTTFQGWTMNLDQAGHLLLRGKLTPPNPSAQDGTGRRPWIGTLDLPAVPLP